MHSIQKLKYGHLDHRKSAVINKLLRIWNRALTVASVKPTLAAGYKPDEVESAYWLREKTNQNQPSKGNCKRGTYRMILPPPNVTGDLHLGHVLNATIQDVICRQHRMLGFDTEWIPGTDHAGIATQIVVEKRLKEQLGLTRQQLGRERFLNEVWKWKVEKKHSIMSDLKRLGCILNWEKEYFTMDTQQVQAVNAAFVRLFDEGLIQRKDSLVNWSCALESTVSDVEVDTLEVKGPTKLHVPGYKHEVLFGRIYDIAYRVDGPGNEEIIVSTTRPETVLGDVAVAVNPNDERYREYRDLAEVRLVHPFRSNHETIPLIFDLAVDVATGTGAVKITPAHDKRDFEIAERHELKAIPVFTKDGRILKNFENFKEMPRFMARTKIIDALSEMGLLREIKDHTLALPLCSRSKDVIEQMMLPQWFLHMQPMADEALSDVKSGRLQIIPSHFEDDWQRWLFQCHDWCISRQLWWGHQIPAYLATNAAGAKCWVAAFDAQTAREKAAKQLGTTVASIERDTDVLDTWFSSALLPFSVHKWPNPDYKKAYPLDLMQTGHDILFFWVARMAMLGRKLTGELPFQRVVFNSIVCDKKGRKMSKSLGNVISPKQVIEGATLQELADELHKAHVAGLMSEKDMKAFVREQRNAFPKGIQLCGADALRFTLCSQSIENHYANFDADLCYTNKLFLNKIWQATRYTLGAANQLGISVCEIETINNASLGLWDRWILSRLVKTLKCCASGHRDFEFHLATAALKQFFYLNLCDVYLETTKANLRAGRREAFFHCATLVACLSWGLQAMAPFTPFIVAELLQHLPLNVHLDLDKFTDAELEQEINSILEICFDVRQLKSQHSISKKHEPQLYLFAQNVEVLELLKRHTEEMRQLTQTQAVEIQLACATTDDDKKFQFISTAGPTCTFAIATNDSYAKPKDVDVTARVNHKKLKSLLNELQSYQLRVENEAFQLTASPKMRREFSEKIKTLEAEINTLKSLAV